MKYAPCRQFGIIVLGLVFLTLSGMVSCSLNDLVGGAEVPAGTADPALVASEQGAKGLYYGVQRIFADAVSLYVVDAGLFSDELRSTEIRNQAGFRSISSLLDSRYLLQGGWGDEEIIARRVFDQLQKARSAAQQSRGALRAYAPLVPRALIGHLYAIEGFSDILLADLYCSGVPLSTIDFVGDYTLKSGSSTQDIYEQAVVLFDSAIALSADSAEIQDFAKVGKARALLALGRYDAVSVTIAGIPLSLRYTVTYTMASPNGFRKVVNGPGSFSVSDGEGVTDQVGVQYVSLQDPRVAVSYREGPDTHVPYGMYLQRKYDTTGTSPIVVASGIEAQLMRAEAEFHAAGPWLATLNDLRTSCVDPDSCPVPAPAGGGGVAGLAPLSDPGNRDARISMLFQERALWLFLTTHRQGDMRRLVRNYEWALPRVYATGPYYRNNAAGVYGFYTNLPIPIAEQQSNPFFHGCLNREA